jgi:hypothetical protein
MVFYQVNPPWVGLEERVCSSAPYDTSPILVSHGTLAAIIAGFGLAGYILLLDRGHEDVEQERSRGHTNGALLFALSAIIGLTSAYLFSALTGDRCMNTQIEFDYPAMLLAMSALLLISGISVVATSHPKLGDTATTLRVVLVVTGVLICVRLAFDYQYSDQVDRSYQQVVDRVEQLSAEADELTGLNPGSTATLDRQLGLYANHKWPNRSSEWPGLLAKEFFDAPAPSALRGVLVATALVAIGVALGVVRMMRPVAARGFGDRSSSEGNGEGVGKQSTAAARAEATWRRWVSRVTVFGAVVVVGMFSVTGAGGQNLMSSPSWQRVVLFGLFTLAVALLIQPPLAGDQRSVPRALWNALTPRSATIEDQCHETDPTVEAADGIRAHS